MNRTAQALGRLARGVPKNFTPADRRRRANLARGLAKRRAAKRAAKKPG